MCLREGRQGETGGKRSVLEYMSIPSPVSMRHGRVQIHFRQCLESRLSSVQIFLVALVVSLVWLRVDSCVVRGEVSKFQQP